VGDFSLVLEGELPDGVPFATVLQAQILSDAVHDGVLGRSPASRPRHHARVSHGLTWPPRRRYGHCMTRSGPVTGPDCYSRRSQATGRGMRAAGSGRGLPTGIVHPVVQYPAEELKTDISRTPVPIPHDLVLELSAHVEQYSTQWIMCDGAGRQLGPWQLARAFRAARVQVPGLPEGFRFHDLRHFYASLLIASGLDVKVVQARLRHASAKTTLDTYGHLWPDSDETTRAAISSVMTTRSQSLAANLRPPGAVVKHLSLSEAHLG
jgi:hypothetical protein